MNEETIAKVIHTLNQIEVHGKENLDKLLGCIMVLEKEIEKSRAKEVKTDA